MEGGIGRETTQFKSPEEELVYLRERVAEQERANAERGLERSRAEVTHETISAYKKADTKDVLHESYRATPSETEAMTLALRPEEHDSAIEELYGMLLERGIKNTLDVIARMKNPHIEDDFHRFLVQFLHASGSVPGLSERNPEWQSLHLSLFEITLPPESSADGKQKSLKELLSGMEQFFAGMQSIGVVSNDPYKQYFTLELAVSHDSPEIVFYVSVPTERRTLLEKQVLAFYHGAKVRQVSDDYNVFIPGGTVGGATASFAKDDVFPLLTYEAFDHDPLQALLAALGKLDKTREGAAIQFLIMPAGMKYVDKFSKTLEKVKKGTSLKNALDDYYETKKELKAFASSIFSSKPKDKPAEEKHIDDVVVGEIGEKIKSSIVVANIRIVASSPRAERTREIMNDIESAFSQFARPNGNALVWNRAGEREIDRLLHSFTFRLPAETALPLNLRELATLVHFPAGATGSPELREGKSGVAPAPLDIGSSGVRIGINSYRGTETDIFLSEIDRMRHFYVIGQTGTGKTGILMNMIRQDIERGDGVCYIDPHGSDIQKILSYIPKERIDDVIYFDPASTARPMGLNMLEFDPERPEQKTLVINELLGIFSQLFDMKTAGGPLFEQYFKNSAGLVMSDPASGNTILEIGRVLSDKKFRDMKLERCTNPIIKQFWKTAEATTGEQGLENFVPYITSKFDTFISNEIMRPIIAQEKSSFNFREILDKKKILLVNLSKGRLGDINANLLGLILVGKIQMAALSRADSHGVDFPPFYLYIDEFQNFTTPSISSILSEARKYKLGLNVAHQYLSQLSDDIRNAVLGNVGSMAVFRISSEDAEVLVKRLEPVFTTQDILKLDNRNAYVSMLMNGVPAKPFNIRTPDLPAGNPDIVESLKELSFLKYGRPRDEVEKEVMDKFMKI